jgi:23S rRNA pseudouridine1911/1915/1917 synthase
MSFRAEPAEAGMRLDAALTARGEAATRSEAQRLIDAGAVTVDGEPRQKSHRLAEGQLVELADPPAEDEPDAGEVPFTVVLEDDALMVIDKPAGVVVHPGAGRHTGTLAQTLRGRAAGGPDPDRAGIVHRLDRDTSGLILVAKSEDAYAALTGMIRRREVERRYLALVEGRPDARAGTIDAPLGRDRARRTAMSTSTDKARSAVTHFEVLEALPRTTLLDVRLETGRTHQIRAHMAAIGHPVCGDARYGGASAGARLGLRRQFLHSAQLMFSHPSTGAQTACESKPPADLLRALEAAKREPVSGGPDGD